MSVSVSGWAKSATVAGLGVITLLAAACGSSGPSADGSGGGGVQAWALTQGSQPTFELSQKNWNKANAKGQVSFQFYSNDAYKQKIRVAIGANDAPVIFENWGGGALKDYADAGKLEDLTASLGSAVSARYFKSVLDVARFDGKLYGVPVNGTQPVVLYYNKDLFAKVGAQPPKTWDDLLALVAKFKKAGIAPLSLAGGSKWPDLMYMEYLVDRIGGPTVFQDIVAGKPGAWQNPAVIKAGQMIQQLVDAGAFANGYQSITYDAGQSSALLYTGRAAMQLMGSWDYAVIQGANAGFIKSGKLGWTNFPSVSGGQGDPSDIVGNPANFFSVTKSSSAAEKSAAAKYLKDGVMDTAYVDDLLKNGNVPPVLGLESKLAAEPNSQWLQYQYDLVKNAPSYQLSWDQALPSAYGDVLLTNLDQLFLKKITPQQFADNLSKAGK
jgi:raffinose/stachyose/melibiose transport system substrate-binding protein